MVPKKATGNNLPVHRNHQYRRSFPVSSAVFGPNSISILTILNSFQLSFTVGQFVKPHSKALDISSLFVSNLQLFAYIILGFLLFATTTTICSKLTEHSNVRPFSLKSLKRTFLAALFMEHPKVSSVHRRLLWLFFGFFIFFHLNFLSGTIKTEGITVSTDELVDSASKLADTSRVILTSFLGAAIIKRAPKKTFLSKLSEKQFLIAYLRDLLRVKRINNYLILTEPISMAFVLNFLYERSNQRDFVVFAKSNSYFEILEGLLMRSSLDEEKKRFINNR